MNMPRKENIEELNALLSQWDGSEASISSIPVPGQEHFTIGLTKLGSTLVDFANGIGCVGITLFYCGYVSGPTRWSNCKLRCRKASFINEYWSPNEIHGYELYDEKANFTIHCYENIRFSNGELYVPAPT